MESIVYSMNLYDSEVDIKHLIKEKNGNQNGTYRISVPSFQAL